MDEKRCGACCSVIGLLIALFGVGIDYLLPGASPGLNLPQLLIIAVQASLIAVGALYLPEAAAIGRGARSRTSKGTAESLGGHAGNACSAGDFAGGFGA